MNRLHLHILASGSKGNCALVEGPQGLVMVDDGLPKREVLSRMDALGLDPRDIRALLITHEHSDHISGVGVLSRALPLEIHASTGTRDARRALDGIRISEFEPGRPMSIAGIDILPFATSHDVTNPVGFRFEACGDAIGFATDTGVLTDAARDALAGARILALESNHDLSMLRCGPYPRSLQDRIASDSGHLSNAQAAQAARELVTNRTEALIAMHISQENNLPSRAVRSLAEALGAELDDELGSAATLARSGSAPALSIRPAGQNRPITIV